MAAGPVNTTGIYQGAFYKGFSLALTMAGQLPIDGTPLAPGIGVIPESGSNAIAFSTADVQTVKDGGAAMDTQYAGSVFKKITLESFYFGCPSGTQLSLASVPLSCQLSVTSKKADGTQIGPQTFDFQVSTGQLRAEMKFASVNGFTGCERVLFDVHGKEAVDGATDLVTAGFVDTITYGLS